MAKCKLPQAEPIRQSPLISGRSRTIPREFNFYLLLGDPYRSKQDWPNAQDSYQKALVLRPENPLAAGQLAFIMLQSGQNLDIALSLRPLAAVCPSPPASPIRWVYYQKGAYQSAIGLLQEALKLQLFSSNRH